MNLTSPCPVIKVVIVEDDLATMRTLCAAIALQPELQVVASFDAITPAIEWLAHNALDVLLTDLGLPDGTGIEVIRACTARHPQCDIMVITMFGDDKNVLASIDAGAVGYILKDADELNVAQFIADLRQGGSPMSPLVARKLLARVQRPQAVESVRRAALLPSLFTPLTPRELEALNLIARGYTYREIAVLLRVGLSTIQTHIKRIYIKLSVHNRGEAVFEAHKLGLLQKGLLSSDAESEF